MLARTQRQPLDVTKWTAGLITEASPLNFPEGASLDEENFVLNRDGTRLRRLGMDFESSYSLITTVIDASTTARAISNYLWENVGEDPNTNYVVHQFGNRLYIFDADETAVSKTILFGGPISLTATTNVRFSFASIQGDLITIVGDQIIRRIEAYTNSYTIAESRIRVRDFWGVDDGYAVDQRPTTLTGLHAYNLYNQGWPASFFCSEEVVENPNEMDRGGVNDPVSLTYARISMYPSNADVIFTAMTALTNGRRAYYPFGLQNVIAGNTPASKGHYIIDLFNRSQGRVDKYNEDSAAGNSRGMDFTSSIPTDQSTGGIRATASYSGRIWYCCSAGETGGDSKSPHVGCFVLFSQLVDNHSDISKCYQDADPTAEDISDLIDTDGGYIQFPNAVNIKLLIPFGSALLVFADNGVWSISGGDKGFSATEYMTDFITNNGLLSESSVVVTEDSILYWSRNGIYAISMGQVPGKLVPQSLSETTIQTFYNSIPYNSKKYCSAFYYDVKQQARWLYQETFNPVHPYNYDRELVLDMSLPAFYKNTFEPLGGTYYPYPTGYIPIPPQSRLPNGADYKYSVAVPSEDTWAFTVAAFNQTEYKDWKSYDAIGMDAPAFLITGYVTGGDTARKKFAPWLTVHCKRTEGIPRVFGTATAEATPSASASYSAVNPSSCMVQARWEWCTTDDSGRWTSEFQAYRYRQPYYVDDASDTISYGYSVISTRNKLRGNGRALSLKFRTEEGCDLQLLGWNIEMGMQKEP